MKYFISYAYFIPKGSQGFGNIEVDRTYPISSTNDVAELTEAIASAMSREMRVPEINISILNFRQFEPDIERKNYSPENKGNVISLRPRM